MKYIYTLFLIGVILFHNQFFIFEGLSASELPSQNQLLLAKIELIKSGEKLEVQGKFYNNSENKIGIEYLMRTDKINHSGTSQSTQSGKYKSEPNSELILTKVGLNIDNDTKYNITLEVFKEGKLICADSLNYTPENN